MKNLLFAALLLSTFTSFNAMASGSKRPAYSTPTKTHYSSSYSPWDFSAMLGLYNPGVGFGGLAAYRIVDGLLPSSNENNLAVEAGFNFISFTSSLGSVAYSVIEIPMHARWDFKVMDGKLIVGPIAGFNYWISSGYTFAGTNYSIGGLFLQLGGSAIYNFTENFGARAQLAVGGFTALTIGITYTP